MNRFARGALTLSLLSLGFAAATGRRTSSAAYGVVALWIVWVVLKVGFRSAEPLDLRKIRIDGKLDGTRISPLARFATNVLHKVGILHPATNVDSFAGLKLYFSQRVVRGCSPAAQSLDACHSAVNHESKFRPVVRSAIFP